MKKFTRTFLAVASVVVVVPAMAQTVDAKAQADTVRGDPSVAPFDAPVVDSGTLSTVIGKADLGMVISARNTSNVSNNSVSGNSVTGSIAFDSSSFSGLNGLSLLSANTGNNVAINSSLNVNVAIRP